MSRLRRTLFTLLLALPGCGQLPSPPPAGVPAGTSAEESVCSHQWLLEQLSVDGQEHRSGLLWQKLWRDRPYFTCDKLGYVRGSAGSNPYLGRFELQDSGRYSWLQPPAISRISDVRDSSELEKSYLRALPQTDNMEVRDDSLIMRDDSGAVRLEFKRAEGAKQ